MSNACALIQKYRLSDLLVELEGRPLPSSEMSILRRLADAMPDLEVLAANYSYGQLILENGVFHPPHEAGSSCRTCSEIRYERRGIPLTLVLDHCVEVYKDDRKNRRTIPLRMIGRGEWFGVFEALDRLRGKSIPTSWSVSAGGRSVVIVAPFGDQRLNRAFGCDHKVDLQRDPWHAYRKVAKREKIDWAVPVLIFPDSALAGREAGEFLNFIYGVGWEQVSHFRMFEFEEPHSGINFIEALKAVSHSHRQLVYATLKHLLALARGELPAFEPVAGSRGLTGPFVEIIEALLADGHPWSRVIQKDVYPVLLQPTHLRDRGSVGYYSIAHPTLLHPDPDTTLSFRQFIETALLPGLSGLESEELGSVRFFCPDKGRTNTRSEGLNLTEQLAEEFLVNMAEQYRQRLSRTFKHGTGWLSAIVRIERP